MKSIGGYFGLEAGNFYHFHEGAIKLNTARNALEYILMIRGYDKVYLPYFICDVIFEPLKRTETEIELYHIDKNFEPLFDFSKVGKNQALLYVNYFGLKNDLIKELVCRCENLIIDNSQSFYSKPIAHVDTFYSPRKFFGVPDGAYLYIDETLKVELKQDVSCDRSEHLLKRIDTGAESGYTSFAKNESRLKNQPIKLMSNLTSHILMSINYESIAEIRRNNFLRIHERLSEGNFFTFELSAESVPMIYPFWTNRVDLRSSLRSRKVYTPIYWTNVLDICNEKDLEYQFVNNVVYLPIDQRYSFADIDYLVRLILQEQ
ncbi:hypothetical protein [Roseivirga sp.]|uniref:hypothetical protein n=1 Tax=Roseivirga sp. TaxID=1964215 RepID=UPI003B520241